MDIHINSDKLFRLIDERITDISELKSADEKREYIVSIIDDYSTNEQLKEPLLNRDDYIFLIQCIYLDQPIWRCDSGLRALQGYIFYLIYNEGLFKDSYKHFQE